MKKSRFSEARILGILRQQDQGQTVGRLCREPGLREPTFYAWKSKFGGRSVSELRRLKHLEDDNRRRQQLYAELRLEHQGTNGSFRRELLNAYLFTSLRQVREQCLSWQYDDNHLRPHEALNFLTPSEFCQAA